MSPAPSLGDIWKDSFLQIRSHSQFCESHGNGSLGATIVPTPPKQKKRGGTRLPPPRPSPEQTLREVDAPMSQARQPQRVPGRGSWPPTGTGHHGPLFPSGGTCESCSLMRSGVLYLLEQTHPRGPAVLEKGEGQGGNVAQQPEAWVPPALPRELRRSWVAVAWGQEGPEAHSQGEGLRNAPPQ